MPPALAANCSGANCYAVGYTLSGGTNWGGGSARWDTRSYTAPDWASGGFASEVIWVLTRSGDSCPVEGGYAGVEEGYTHGWQGQNIRTLYWVDGCPYTEYRITAYSAGSVGSLHVYTIQQHTSTAYRVYFDYNYVAQASETPWTREVEVGLEATDQGATFPTTTDDALQYRDSGCCTGHWHSWPNGYTYENRPPYDWTWITNYTKGRNGRCGC